MRDMIKFISNYYFELLVGISLGFFLFYYLFFRIGKKGSYSRNYSYSSPFKTSPKHSMPKESRSEFLCRWILERIFNKKFPNIRPDFLKNSVTGHNLELDCYNAELGLAVEYNGRQHYDYCPGIHKNRQDFLTQKYRDEMKVRLCKDNNVFLIVIPYTVKEDDLEKHLVDKLIKEGFITT